MQDTGSGSFGPLCPTPSPRLLSAPLSRLNLPYSGNTWHTSSKTLLNWSPLCFLCGFTSTAVIVLWKLSTSTATNKLKRSKYFYINIYLGKTWSKALFKIDTIIRTKIVMIILIILMLIILINLRPPCPANFNLIVKSIPYSHNYFFALVSHFYRKLIYSGTWEKWHLRGVKLGKQQKIGKGDRCDLFALLGAWKIG